MTVGARFFDYEKDESNLTSGPFSGAAPGDSILVTTSADETGNSGKLNLSYTPSDDVLIYAQWAEGFRLGKPQLSVPASICDTDGDGIMDGTSLSVGLNSTDPDELESFEIGGKFSSHEGRLIVNGSLYQNKWEGIPVTVFGDNTQCQLVANAGEAETTGIEIETTYAATDNLQLALAASYSEAELTEDVASLGALDCDRLPGSPRVNANLSLQYDFRLASYKSFVRVDYAWIGGFYSDLQEATPEAGDYGLMNLKGNIAIEDLTFELYVKNLTGEDELSYWNQAFGGVGSRLRPRTLGFNISYQF